MTDRESLVPDDHISSEEYKRAAMISQRMSQFDLHARPMAIRTNGQRNLTSLTTLSSNVDYEDDHVTAYVQTETPMQANGSLLNTPTAAGGASTPRSAPSNAAATVAAWKPSARRLLKKRSTRELVEEERFSLPTLESMDSVIQRRQQRSNERTYTNSSDMSDRVFLNRTLQGNDQYDVYFVEESPMEGDRFPHPVDQLEDQYVPGSSRTRATTEPTEDLAAMLSRRAPVITEVGDSLMSMPIVHHQASLRQSALLDQMSHKDESCLQTGHCSSTTPTQGYKARASALVPSTLIAHPTMQLVAPHVTMEETQKYTFAIVLRHTHEVYQILRRRFPSKSAASIRRDLEQNVSQLQQKCVRRLIQAGLGVMVLENDIYGGDGADQDEEQAGKNICILVNPKKDKDLLVHEFKREMDELSIQQGEGMGRMAEESLDSIKNMCFSPALELQLTHNIIQNAFKDYDKEDWLVDVNRELTIKDVIKEYFPLHDRLFNKKFFAEYRRRTFDMRMHKAASGNSDRWAVEELRLHFGERVAFLFAFMHIYTKHLLPITALGVVYYLAFRFLQGPIWREYLQGLSLIGFGVACFWGPSFLICWERETRILVEKWNLAKYKNTVYEKNDYNPNFQYMWVKNELTREMEKVPKKRRNHFIQVTMLFFVLVSAIVQCVCLVPFIQWYVYAKNAPTCLQCHGDTTNAYDCLWFISCFNSETSALGTDRWVYILIQGVLLGLLIDIVFFEVFNWISEKFVQWENYAKKSDYENRLIHRRFVFVWSNWFFWFLFIAFVYLPFGDQFLRYFRTVGLGKLAPYEWDPAKLTLDSLFVTPLVVTQFLNLLLETIVPYLMRKLRGRPMTCRKSTPIAWCMHKLKNRMKKKDDEEDAVPVPAGPARTQRRAKSLTAKRLVQLVKQRTGFQVDVMPVSDDTNQYSAYEIIAESKLPIFDPMLDYLDACIQFSYVVMFTVVWPLLPLPALVNNILEVRGDAFRLLFAQRRPMPRRDTSIGEWATVLSYANIISITAVMGFIVVYHWGYFMVDCDYPFGDGVMVPFSQLNTTMAANPAACRDSGTGTYRWMMIQIILFVVLEHFGFCLRYLVLQVDKTPAAIRSSGYQRLKHVQKLTSARVGRASQFEYIQKLKKMFDTYDTERDGHLREPDLVAFLAEWICKHPSELLPYSSIIFRYMDKNGIGKIPFSTCCLMLQHVNHDRFFSCLLGLYDPIYGDLNQEIRNAEDGMQLRRVMSEVSSVVSQRNSMASVMSDGNYGRPRDSSFFYMN